MELLFETERANAWLVNRIIFIMSPSVSKFLESGNKNYIFKFLSCFHFLNLKKDTRKKLCLTLKMAYTQSDKNDQCENVPKVSKHSHIF